MASLLIRGSLLLMLVGSIAVGLKAPPRLKSLKSLRNPKSLEKEESLRREESLDREESLPADEPVEWVIKRDDYDDDNDRNRMNQLREVTEGRDPSKPSRKDRPTGIYKIQTPPGLKSLKSLRRLKSLKSLRREESLEKEERLEEEESLEKEERLEEEESLEREESLPAYETPEWVIKLSDYDDENDRHRMEQLREVTEGRDPCKPYRKDPLTGIYKIQNVSNLCSRAIRAFAELPETAHGPCRGFKFISKGVFNTMECVSGKGERDGYCAIGMETVTTPSDLGNTSPQGPWKNRRSMLSLERGEIEKIPLENCTKHLRFEL